MDKDSKEALQVAKELTAKFIETRTVSPGNFAGNFPVVFRVVAATIRENQDNLPSGKAVRGLSGPYSEKVRRRAAPERHWPRQPPG